MASNLSAPFSERVAQETNSCFVIYTLALLPNASNASLEALEKTASDGHSRDLSSTLPIAEAVQKSNIVYTHIKYTNILYIIYIYRERE